MEANFRVLIMDEAIQFWKQSIASSQKCYTYDFIPNGHIGQMVRPCVVTYFDHLLHHHQKRAGKYVILDVNFTC